MCWTVQPGRWWVFCWLCGRTLWILKETATFLYIPVVWADKLIWTELKVKKVIPASMVYSVYYVTGGCNLDWSQEEKYCVRFTHRSVFFGPSLILSAAILKTLVLWYLLISKNLLIFKALMMFRSRCVSLSDYKCWLSLWQVRWHVSQTAIKTQIEAHMRPNYEYSRGICSLSNILGIMVCACNVACKNVTFPENAYDTNK